MKPSIKLTALLFASTLFHTSSYAGDIVGAEFSSMAVCLASIKKNSGMELRILTDKPDNVSGYLGNTKRDFACTKKVTGSKGTYYEGWYEITE